MLKVADFGTSRFLEIAAHGTTVIGSPPYMAPEQFHGKAVFASDIYSLGVTMYQMLTGVLPYDTPAPADLDKLMSGELVSPPRLKNPAIPKADQRHRDARDGAGGHRALPARAGSAGRRAGGARRRAADAAAAGAAGQAGAGRSRGARDDAQGDPDAAARARSAGRAVLLAVPQAAARAHRPLSVLRRDAVDRDPGSRSRTRAIACDWTRQAGRRPAMLRSVFASFKEC